MGDSINRKKAQAKAQSQGSYDLGISVEEVRQQMEAAMAAMYEGTITFEVQPRPSPPKPRGVTWDDVIGQIEAKAAMREAIEGATKHAALYKKYGRRPTKGVLLFGPPGNGKTMLGKAAASALAEMYGQQVRESGFIYLKGPELASSYYGQTEQHIRDLFAKAKRHKMQHGYPAIIFLDEAESMLMHRAQQIRGLEAVPAFLAEMDGMEDCAAVVILATNRPDSLDSAIIREGRIDRKIAVGRPTHEDALKLFSTCLHGRPLLEGLSVQDLATHAVSVLFDPTHVLYRINTDEGTKRLTLGHVTSGAQITFLVDAAATFAIEREIATGEVGIRNSDVTEAIKRTLREQRDLDHGTELFTFCETFLHAITGIERVKSDGTVIGRRSVIAHVHAHHCDAGGGGVGLAPPKDFDRVS